MTTTDVVVVGSGAAGLTAALVAAREGLEVIVVEKAPVLGGTSVVSGGSIWAPANRYLAGADRSDSLDSALTYLREITMGQVDDTLLTAFLESVNPMLDTVVELTEIGFEVNLDHPDYQPGLPGAMPGGRTIQGDLFDSNLLGDFKDKLRSAHSGVPITRLEVDAWGQDTIDRWDWALIADRVSRGIVGLGSALVGRLLYGCLKLGVRVHVSSPAGELVIGPDGAVCGVDVDLDGRPTRIGVRRGVVLASGGFEWDPTLVTQFLGRPMESPASPPGNTGDGLRMAMGAGAALGNMSEAWWTPTIHATGDTYDGAPLSRPTSSLRALPGGVMVNRHGRRFVNEAMNYNDLCKALSTFDPQEYRYANQPCWLIFDQRFRSSYSVATCTPDTPTPSWMPAAGTLAELAEKVGIDAGGLVDQMARYNEYSARGVDPEFHRGESPYDTYRGDPKVGPHRNLRPLEEGPFYAVQVHLGALGTKGGPVTDATGNVQRALGGPIGGLYACGNVAASAFGVGYPGAGATLAAGMTFGYLSARALADA